MTAAAESLMPAVRRVLASSESLDQSIAQVNGLHKGVLRVGVFNSACVVWLPRLVPEFEKDYPGIEVEVYQAVTPILKHGSKTVRRNWLSFPTPVPRTWISSRCTPTRWSALHRRILCPNGREGSAPMNCGGWPFVSQRADTDATSRTI